MIRLSKIYCSTDSGLAFW